jgi:hypothetical protein
MFGVHDLIFRPDELQANLDLLFGDLKRAAWSRLARAILFSLPVIFIGHWLYFNATGSVWVVPIIGGVIILMIVLRQLDRYRRKRNKIQFISEIMNGLQVDLHPRRKVRMEIDIRPYDHGAKLIWSGQAPGGKPKEKYRDKWLSIDVMLADGTKLEIRREIGIKTKSGSVQTEKRRLFLSIVPNPKRYDLTQIAADADKLRKRLKDALHALFETHPDDFHVHVDPAVGGLRIKVSQETAPIIAEEVMKLVHALIGFLAARRARK